MQPVIRARFVFIIAVALVPFALAGILLVGYDYFDRERTRLERDATATARALVAAVDADLAGARSALLVLATSTSLRAGDLAAFHAQAKAAMEGQIFVNFILSDERGRQLVNTFRPFGEPLPTQGDPGGLLQVFKTGRPVTSGLFTGRLTGQQFIGIGAPVKAGDEVRYALSGGVSPAHFSPLLAQQRLPETWIVAILDPAGTIVARSHEAGRFVGRPAAPELVARAKQAPEGAFDARTLEGIATRSVFSRSATTGWAVAIGIPQSELTGHLLLSLGRLFTVAFIMLAGALLTAVLLARRL